MAQHLQGAVQLIISFTFSSLSFRCLHFKMCNGKQAKIMLNLLKIAGKAARRKEWAEQASRAEASWGETGTAGLPAARPQYPKERLWSLDM